MAATHTTQDGQTYQIPDGLELRGGMCADSVRCADCGSWEHLDGALPRIRHSRRCDTRDLQVSFVAPAAPATEIASAAAPEIVEECWECGATFATHGNVERGGMCCRLCR